MNEMVEKAIISRKESIYNYYEINEEIQKKKVEDLFDKIMNYGKDYSDYQKFEEDFAKSTLNQEYINLFTELSKTCKIKDLSDTTENSSKDYEQKNEITDTITSEIKYQLKSSTLPFRRKARQKAMSELRGIPVLGDLIQLKQTKDLINKYKRK